jgi:hypothetical protein
MPKFTKTCQKAAAKRPSLGTVLRSLSRFVTCLQKRQASRSSTTTQRVNFTTDPIAEVQPPATRPSAAAFHFGYVVCANIVVCRDLCLPYSAAAILCLRNPLHGICQLETLYPGDPISRSLRSLSQISHSILACF